MVIYYFRFLTFLPSQKFSNPTFLKNYIVYIYFYIVYTIYWPSFSIATEEICIVFYPQRRRLSSCTSALPPFATLTTKSGRFPGSSQAKKLCQQMQHQLFNFISKFSYFQTFWNFIISIFCSLFNFLISALQNTILALKIEDVIKLTNYSDFFLANYKVSQLF